MTIILCSLLTVNNTLPEAEKDKDTTKDKEIIIYSDRDFTKTKEKGQDNTGEKESVGGRDRNTGHENTTEVSREDKYTTTLPEETVTEDRTKEEPEERNTGSEKPTGGSDDKEDSKGSDSSSNTVEKKEPEVRKPPEKKEEDKNLDIEKTDITEIVVKKDKGQEEKERKEEQVNGKRERDKVGPNDTKLRTVISEGENTVEIFELEMTKNNTIQQTTKDMKTENNTILSGGRRLIPTRVNITHYTLYRGGEESERVKEKPTIKKEKKDDKTPEKTKEELEREKEKEKEREINQSLDGKIIIWKNKSNEFMTISFSFIHISCLFSCRKKLPSSASPLSWLPPAGLRSYT